MLLELDLRRRLLPQRGVRHLRIGVCRTHTGSMAALEPHAPVAFAPDEVTVVVGMPDSSLDQQSQIVFTSVRPRAASPIPATRGVSPSPTGIANEGYVRLS